MAVSWRPSGAVRVWGKPPRLLRVMVRRLPTRSAWATRSQRPGRAKPPRERKPVAKVQVAPSLNRRVWLAAVWVRTAPAKRGWVLLRKVPSGWRGKSKRLLPGRMRRRWEALPSRRTASTARVQPGPRPSSKPAVRPKGSRGL